MPADKLPEVRAVCCTWLCTEYGFGGESCKDKCPAYVPEICAMRLEGRKGPTYQERKILPPAGMFKEKRHA